MRIRKAQKHTDPTDPDPETVTHPEHCHPAHLLKVGKLHGAQLGVDHHIVHSHLKR
jgi:hypothetical protein